MPKQNHKRLTINVMHPRREEPVETIDRTPRQSGDRQVVSYNRRDHEVFDGPDGTPIIWANRPKTGPRTQTA